MSFSQCSQKQIKNQKNFKTKNFKFPRIHYTLSHSCTIVSCKPLCDLLFPCPSFCENLPPKEQMMPNTQGKSEFLKLHNEVEFSFVERRVPVAGVGQHCGIKESCFAVQL
jgi:hypothetical protein